MKSRITIIALIASLIFLTGCASGPSYQEYSANIPEIPAESGRIYIYRTTTFGAAVQPGVKINDDVVGKAVPKGFFYVDLPAGDYVVSASTEAERSLSLSLEPTDERYVRLEVQMGAFVGHIKPVLVDNSEGAEEITGTSYTGEVAGE